MFNVNMIRPYCPVTYGISILYGKTEPSSKAIEPEEGAPGVSHIGRYLAR